MSAAYQQALINVSIASLLHIKYQTQTTSDGLFEALANLKRFH